MLSWLPGVSFWVTQSCGDGRERPLMQLWLANFWAWIIVLRAVPYTLSFLTPEVNVREVLGPTLNPETVRCSRTNLFHHYMVCILSQHEQNTDSAPYSRDPLAQTKLHPDSLSRKMRSITWSELPACCWAGTLCTTDLMQLLAAHGPCPGQLLHSAAPWWAPRCWQLDGQLCNLPGLAMV